MKSVNRRFGGQGTPKLGYFSVVVKLLFHGVPLSEFPDKHSFLLVFSEKKSNYPNLECVASHPSPPQLASSR